MTLIQLPDDHSSELGEILCYCPGDVAAHRMGEFVIINCKAGQRVYFGMVSAPQRNHNRTGLTAREETTLSALEAVNDGIYQRASAVEEAFMYPVALLREVTLGKPEVITLRPQIAAIARTATEEEVVKFMALPEANAATCIGQIQGQDVGLYCDSKRLVYHTLLAGSTGAGKSNTGANMIKAGAELGFATVVYDHKPDYQDMEQANPEVPKDQQWAATVSRWCLDASSNGGTQVLVPASAFDPAMLAATLMPFDNERQMREDMETALENFADHREERGLDVWTLADFYDWFTENGIATKQIEPKLGYEPHKATLAGMLRRLCRTTRKPAWVDGIKVDPSKRDRPEFMGRPSGRKTTQWFEPVEELAAGEVLCIKVNGSEAGRDYGLFLDFMLRQVYNARIDPEIECPPVHHFIDEAQDIFCANKGFKEAAERTLSTQIRKGRSKKIAFTVAVQSAESIPSDILNNLNSKIIMRHNSATEVKTAIGKATDAQRGMTAQFGPGQALVDLFGSTAVVQGKMRLSPCLLTKEAE
jgi:hypothetical protein